MPRDPMAIATSPPAASATPHSASVAVGRRGDVVERRLVEPDAHPVERDVVAHGSLAHEPTHVVLDRDASFQA